LNKKLARESDKRLMHLVHSGLCPKEDPLKYAAELKQLVNEVADVGEAERRSKVFKALLT
jgi:hypothetical protein